MKAATITALIMLALASARTAGAAQPARVNAWTTPHVFTISDAGDVSTLNPHLTQAAAVANMSEMTMAWLIRWDKHNQPYPELATAVPTLANGGITKDGMTITYHLRHGVKWADGAPFNADDVVFSSRVVNDPANAEGARFDQLASLEEPDKYTVIAHLKKPSAAFLETFFSSCCANPSLLPKHLLAKYRSINDVPYNNLPVGIGPFKFERWDKSKQIVLVANPLYWRGRPKLDKIVYKIVPTRDELLAQVAAHQVDMWYQFSGAYLDRVQAVPGYKILRQPSYAWNHLDFNLSHPMFADVRVRQALRLALDRRGMLDSIAHGVGVVQDSATPVSAPFFADLGTTPYDPAQANALLDAAGWNRGPDGIRAKDGVKLDITVAVSAGQSDTDKQLAFIAENWKQVGAALHADRYPAAQMFAPAKDGGVIFGSGKWDAVIFAWAADPAGDYSNMFACNQFAPAGFNVLHWCNKTADAAMDALIGHYQDSERNADVRTVMQEFVRDTPSIVLAIREDIFAFNSDLKNYEPNTITPFDNMMDVDI